MGYRSRAPVKETCPDIDRAKKDIDNILEDLRDANAQLRAWGNEEAEHVDVLEGEIDTLKDTINDMQSTIEELTAELKEAQAHNT